MFCSIRNVPKHPEKDGCDLTFVDLLRKSAAKVERKVGATSLRTRDVGQGIGLRFFTIIGSGHSRRVVGRFLSSCDPLATVYLRSVSEAARQALAQRLCRTCRALILSEFHAGVIVFAVLPIIHTTTANRSIYTPYGYPPIAFCSEPA